METEYERNQRFNFLVSYLHSLRYRNIVQLVRAVKAELGERPMTIVDIGCAHAKLFATLNERLAIDYTGIDTNSGAVEAARARYAHCENFRVILGSAQNLLHDIQNVDVIVALETFEHIPESDVVRIVESVAAAKPRLFVCSVPVEIGPAVWVKNIGSFLTGYSRHREYQWFETFWAGLYQLDRFASHDTGHKGFDWRWLAQTIRHNMLVKEIRRLPFGFLPAPFAFSVFMVAEPRPAMK